MSLRRRLSLRRQRTLCPRTLATDLEAALTAVFIPESTQDLSLTQRVLVALTQDARQRAGSDLEALVELVVLAPDTPREICIESAIAVMRGAYQLGDPSWGRLFAALAFCCAYASACLGETRRTARALAGGLAQIVMSDPQHWLQNQGGLEAGLRLAYPGLWCTSFVRAAVSRRLQRNSSSGRGRIDSANSH